MSEKQLLGAVAHAKSAQAVEDGGPAFPRDHAHDGHNGMTIRDYFAAKAMAAHIAHEGSDEIHEPGVASWAYQMADAMLKARNS